MKQWLIEIKPHSFDLEVLSCPKLAIVAFIKKGVASGDILEAVLRRFAYDSKSDMAFFKVDVDQCKDVATRYRVNKTPTTLIFIKGEIVAHFIGVVSTQKIRSILEALS